MKKRREEKSQSAAPVEAENKTKVLTVDVNGQPYVTVAYGAVDPATLNAAAGGTPAAQTVARWAKERYPFSVGRENSSW